MGWAVKSLSLSRGRPGKLPSVYGLCLGSSETRGYGYGSCAKQMDIHSHPELGEKDLGIVKKEGRGCFQAPGNDHRGVPGQAEGLLRDACHLAD